MASTNKPQMIDMALVARSVRNARRNEGLSQTELARRSGVDLASVYRVERGRSVHLTTLKKIAHGLQIVFEDLMLDKSSGSGHSLAIHSSSLAMWFPSEDRRPRLPESRFEDYQNESERLRLGHLNFVPFFMCPPLIIPPNGPGIVLIDVMENVPGPYNAEFYEDGALYLLKGGAVGVVGGESFELEEGDWLAFKTRDLQRLGPAPGHEFARMLWIGATRIKRQSGTKTGG